MTTDTEQAHGRRQSPILAAFTSFRYASLGRLDAVPACGVRESPTPATPAPVVCQIEEMVTITLATASEGELWLRNGKQRNSNRQ